MPRSHHPGLFVPVDNVRWSGLTTTATGKLGIRLMCRCIKRHCYVPFDLQNSEKARSSPSKPYILNFELNLRFSPFQEHLDFRDFLLRW